MAGDPQGQSNNQPVAGQNTVGQNTSVQSPQPAQVAQPPSGPQVSQGSPVESTQPVAQVPDVSNIQSQKIPVGPKEKLQPDGSSPPEELKGSSSSIQKERDIIKVEEKDVKVGSRLGDLLVPLLSLGILILIVVFIFIPFGTEVTETRDQTKELRAEIKRNEEKIETLSSINLSELEDRMDTVSVVVRDTMDVSEMAIEVERFALENNLEPLDQSATNTQDVVSSSSTVDYDWVPSYAQAISGPFSYKGEFSDLTGFLDDLRNNTKTILSMGSVSILRSTASEEEDPEKEYWIINLLISGYTAEPIQTANIADSVRTDIDENLFNEMKERAGEISEDTDAGG